MYKSCPKSVQKAYKKVYKNQDFYNNSRLYEVEEDERGNRPIYGIALGHHARTALCLSSPEKEKWTLDDSLKKGFLDNFLDMVFHLIIPYS